MGVLLLASGLGTRVSASPEDAASAADRGAAAAGEIAFAADLYSRLKSRPGNLFFSPYSLSSALALAYEGASGATAAEMSRTLHLAIPPDRLRSALGGISRDLAQGESKGGYSLSLANGLWCQKGAALLPSFLAAARGGFGAGAEQVDFKKDAEGSRRAVNSWVAGRTGGKIQELLGPESIRDSTRLILTNAVYFKGKWASEFRAKQTQTGPFHAGPGKDLDAAFMAQSGEFAYMANDLLQALEMPYAGDAVSFVALLPRNRSGLPELEKALSAAALGEWLGKMQKRDVHVFFPRFKLNGQFALAAELQALGMREAFEKKTADFSRMNGRRPGGPEAFAISDVFHKSFVEVNEEGTEAAAATAVIDLTEGAAPTPNFRADHPFLFLIRDRRSGAVLFLGRLADLSGSSL